MLLAQTKQDFPSNCSSELYGVQIQTPELKASDCFSCDLKACPLLGEGIWRKMLFDLNADDKVTNQNGMCGGAGVWVCVRSKGRSKGTLTMQFHPTLIPALPKI